MTVRERLRQKMEKNLLIEIYINSIDYVLYLNSKKELLNSHSPKIDKNSPSTPAGKNNFSDFQQFSQKGWAQSSPNFNIGFICCFCAFSCLFLNHFFPDPSPSSSAISINSVQASVTPSVERFEPLSFDGEADEASWKTCMLKFYLDSNFNRNHRPQGKRCFKLMLPFWSLPIWNMISLEIGKYSINHPWDQLTFLDAFDLCRENRHLKDVSS